MNQQLPQGILTEIKHHSQRIELKYQEAASMVILNHLPEGLLLLDASGCVVFCNKKAEEILDQNDGIALRQLNGHKETLGLVTRDMATQMALESTIKAITTPNVYATKHFPLTMTIQRSLDKAPFHLRFVSISQPNHPLLSANAICAMVLITESEKESSLCPVAMKTAYGISRAEARLAELLVNGDTVKEAARKLNISANTVKTQLQDIYLKTNTNSRAKLAKMLLNLTIVK